MTTKDRLSIFVPKIYWSHESVSYMEETADDCTALEPTNSYEQDWVDSFKSKSLEEMERERKAYKYYLPSPWYRKYFTWYVGGGMVIGFGGSMITTLAAFGSAAPFFLVYVVIAFLLSLYAFSCIPVILCYNRFSSDPIDLLVDAKPIRDGLERGDEYTHIDKPTGYMREGL